MNDIMDKTYKLIDVLDSSDIIHNLTFYKNKIMNNKDIQELINKGNNTDDEYIIRDIRVKLYKYNDYKNYMDNYNKLMYIVMDINNKLKSLTKDKVCFR